MVSDIIEKAVADWSQLVHKVDSVLVEVKSPERLSIVDEEYNDHIDGKDKLDIDFFPPQRETKLVATKEEEINVMEAKSKSSDNYYDELNAEQIHTIPAFYPSSLSTTQNESIIEPIYTYSDYQNEENKNDEKNGNNFHLSKVKPIHSKNDLQKPIENNIQISKNQNTSKHNNQKEMKDKDKQIEQHLMRKANQLLKHYYNQLFPSESVDDGFSLSNNLSKSKLWQFDEKNSNTNSIDYNENKNGPGMSFHSSAKKFQCQLPFSNFRSVQ